MVDVYLVRIRINEVSIASIQSNIIRIIVLVFALQTKVPIGR